MYIRVCEAKEGALISTNDCTINFHERVGQSGFIMKTTLLLARSFGTSVAEKGRSAESFSSGNGVIDKRLQLSEGLCGIISIILYV